MIRGVPTEKAAVPLDEAAGGSGESLPSFSNRRDRRRTVIQQPQQTGTPLIIMQQVPPALHMDAMQSQQAWIMAQQSASPLVQVMQTPPLIISHRHMPIVMLQQQTIMPFSTMQQLHMPPAIMVQRFWSMVAEVGSSHLQTTFIPPAHFSMVMAQRGTIIHCGADGMAVAPPMVPEGLAPMPIIPMPGRSIIIAVFTSRPSEVPSPGSDRREAHASSPFPPGGSL
jgi:hypothetical protein